MFRIIVISLIVTNLLLFGFQAGKPAVERPPVSSQVVSESTGIPTIHLYSELIQDQESMDVSRQCFSLGPFHSIEDRDAFQADLASETFSISERQTEALVEKGYWVFMPPYGSQLEANHEYLFLQGLGLEDIGVVREGEWKNAISMGYFRNQENAQKRIKKLKDKGYTPAILVRRQTEPRYWLDYEQSPGSPLPALDMGNRPNDFMRRSLPCPDQDLLSSATGDTNNPVSKVVQAQITDGDENE